MSSWIMEVRVLEYRRVVCARARVRIHKLPLRMRRCLHSHRAFFPNHCPSLWLEIIRGTSSDIKKEKKVFSPPPPPFFPTYLFLKKSLLLDQCSDAPFTPSTPTRCSGKAWNSLELSCLPSDREDGMRSWPGCRFGFLELLKLIDGFAMWNQILDDILFDA